MSGIQTSVWTNFIFRDIERFLSFESTAALSFPFAIAILVLMSLELMPLLYFVDPRYLKWSTCSTVSPSTWMLCTYRSARATSNIFFCDIQSQIHSFSYFIHIVGKLYSFEFAHREVSSAYHKFEMCLSPKFDSTLWDLCIMHSFLSVGNKEVWRYYASLPCFLTNLKLLCAFPIPSWLFGLHTGTSEVWLDA